ncbi:MAG: zinc-dependent alcohol dehydrogenase family protein [Planctomycetaceae bacterium]|nr:zinc-dependent alcohol dehydrogenase family protein [Planctomycetaceae bacterium]
MVLNAIAPIDSSPLTLTDVSDPQPGRGQVRLRVSCCAICRTDLHVIEGELPQQKLPIIPGHQIVGRVDAMGEGCTQLTLGQRVGVAWLRHTCGQCEFCTSHRENLCGDQRFTGYHEDGGYAELAVIDEDFAYEIPDGFADTQAAPLLCAGIVGYRALKRANLPSGGTLAIYGFGSSAHVIFQIARHRGCRVFVVTRGASHAQLARDMGAAWAGASAADMPENVDSAIVFAPAGELVPAALSRLKKGGTLSLADIYMTPIPQMDYQQCLFFERDVRSVTANTRQDGRELLAEAAAIPIRPHVTTYPLAQANRALQDLKSDRINGTGVLIVD